MPKVLPQFALPNTHYYHRGAFAFSADSRTVAVATLNGVNVWNVRKQTLEAVAAKHDFFTNSLAFSPDGKWLALGKNDGEVQIWDRATDTLAAALPVTKWSIYHLAFSPDSRLVAADADNGTVQVWNVASRQRKWTLGKAAKDSTVGLCLSSDGQMLAVLSALGRIALWDMAMGQMRQTWSISPLNDIGTDDISFGPNDRTLFLSGSPLHSWNSRTGKPLPPISLPDALQEKFDFTSKGIGIIDRLVFPPQILPSPDGSLAAILLDSGHIALWDVKTRTVQRLLVGETVSNLGGGGVEGPEFSPDGRWVAAMTDAGDREVWPTQSDKSAHQVY